MPKGSRVDVFSPITAALIAAGHGEKPAQPLGSYQNGPGRTPREPMAKPSGSSRLFWLSGLTRWPFRPQPSETNGYRVIWGSIAAAGAIWPWLAAPPFSSSDLLRAT